MVSVRSIAKQPNPDGFIKDLNLPYVLFKVYLYRMKQVGSMGLKIKASYTAIVFKHLKYKVSPLVESEIKACYMAISNTFKGTM